MEEVLRGGAFIEGQQLKHYILKLQEMLLCVFNMGGLEMGSNPRERATDAGETDSYVGKGVRVHL